VQDIRVKAHREKRGIQEAEVQQHPHLQAPAICNSPLISAMKSGIIYILIENKDILYLKKGRV
jgi:hypothetical protein